MKSHNRCLILKTLTTEIFRTFQNSPQIVNQKPLAFYTSLALITRVIKTIKTDPILLE